ncbi:MAG: riboflavin synthase [Actinomycetota bacterium]|nr:riboflavin synthase [Actinomycetota bacterium]
MFTGIVQEVGRVAARDGAAEGIRLGVRARATAAEVERGDSVAVSGVCLTVSEIDGEVLTFDVVPETLARSSLARVAPGGAVNLERALRAGEPLGGHIVQGHVDGSGSVRSVTREGDGRRLSIELPPALARYCAVKGSVAVDGVSLTIAALVAASFEVALVPHTLATTTLGSLEPGDEVNLEVDVLAKYVERLLESRGALG